MFGFAKQCKKGDFPHKFNNPENYNYIGPMPDLKYYDIDRMKEDIKKLLNLCGKSPFLHSFAKPNILGKFFNAVPNIK